MTKPVGNTFPVLTGDIGGTHARFQLVVGKDEKPIDFDVVKTASYETIEQAIDSVVLPKTGKKPSRAIIAAAGPITPDGLDLTNCHWNIRPKEFLAHSQADELILMNDFEAQALSLPFLSPEDVMMVGERGQLQDRTKVVLGPGTGLGVGLLVRADGKWVPVAGEGGHVDLGPRNAREIAVWEHLEKVEGRVSAEQVVCGDGLVNLYNACCRADGVATEFTEAADISGAAMNSNNIQAEEALTIFCTCLGRIAGDLAITTNARGGVYIAGGIGKKIAPFLAESPFRSAFDDKAPHSEIMKSMATCIVTHDLPALVGLAGYAAQPQSFALDIRHRQWWR